MKILSLALNDIRNAQYGLPEYLKYFNNYFEAKGHEILLINIVITPPPKPEDIVEIMDITPNVKQILIHIEDFFMPVLSDVWKYTDIYKLFYKLLQKYTPDITVMNDWFFAPVLKAFEITPVVNIVHLFAKGLNEALGIKDFDNEAVLQAVKSEEEAFKYVDDLIIANSNEEAQDIAKFYPEVKSKLIAIPLGVDKTVYTYSPNFDSRIILYFGRLDKQKNIIGLLKNVDEYHELLKKNGYEVWIAGFGEHFADVALKHFEGKIKYIGQVVGENKIEILKKVKYCVFPSIYEPYGLALNEALAMGKICVASDVGGHKTQIKNKSNGFLIKDDNYIGKIFEIEGDRKLQEKVAMNAAKTANDIYKHLEILEDIINEIVANGKKVAKRP